jgi:hypothetical protein
MAFRGLKYALVLGGALASALGSVHGQQPPSRRGQPILFSEPRYDPALSNLNEIATQESAFQNPAKELKKPSDIFDAGEGSLITPPLPQLPRPVVNSKRLKALLDKRHDREFQTSQDLATMLTAEEIFKIPEFDRDGREKKKKTAMERAYEGLEREHLGTTNQAKGDDLFGRQREHETRDEPTFLVTEKTPGVAANIPALTSKPLFGGDSSGVFFPEMDRSRSFSESFGLGNIERPEDTRARETRLQNYRQLLDSGPLTPPVAVSPPNSAPAATPGFIPPRGLDSPSGATPLRSLPTTTVGAPLTLPGSPGNNQSLTPSPPPRTPLPPAAFEMPKRKF